MATQGLRKYHIEPFWDDEFKSLNYVNETFNDPKNIKTWLEQGYPDRFTGDMCDMRQAQPSWNQQFIDIFEDQGWQDIGTSYYRMSTGTVLPMHSDLYVKYIKLFGLQGREQRIRRAVVFLEDWKSGHYFEMLDEPVIKWRAGKAVEIGRAHV